MCIRDSAWTYRFWKDPSCTDIGKTVKCLSLIHISIGAAIGTTAGNAAATPAALATAGVISTQVSEAATAQVSAAIIVTAILCPLMVTLFQKFETR